MTQLDYERNFSDCSGLTRGGDVFPGLFNHEDIEDGYGLQKMIHLLISKYGSRFLLNDLVPTRTGANTFQVTAGYAMIEGTVIQLSSTETGISATNGQYVVLQHKSGEGKNVGEIAVVSTLIGAGDVFPIMINYGDTVLDIRAMVEVEVNGKTTRTTYGDSKIIGDIESTNIVCDQVTTTGDVNVGDELIVDGDAFFSGEMYDQNSVQIFGSPVGEVRMYDGTGWTDNVTLVGWYKCDGNNGTPNLVDKFILGHTTASSTGGKTSHSITEAQMPSHNHTVNSHTHDISHTHGVSGATDSDGSHYHRAGMALISADAGVCSYAAVLTSDGASRATTVFPDSGTHYNAQTETKGSHTHTFSTTSDAASTSDSGSTSPDTDNTGSSTAIVWKDDGPAWYSVIFIKRMS